MASLSIRVSDDDNHYEFASTDRLEPTTEEASIAQAGATSHLVRVGQSLGKALAMLR